MYTSKIYSNLRSNRPNHAGSIQTDAYILSTDEVVITPIQSPLVTHQQQYAGQPQFHANHNAVPTTATPVFAYPTIARPQQQQQE